MDISQRKGNAARIKKDLMPRTVTSKRNSSDGINSKISKTSQGMKGIGSQRRNVRQRRPTFPLPGTMIYQQKSPPRLKNRHSQNQPDSHYDGNQKVDQKCMMLGTAESGMDNVPKVRLANRSRFTYVRPCERQGKEGEIMKLKPFVLVNKPPLPWALRKKSKSLVYVRNSPMKRRNGLESCDINSDSLNLQASRRFHILSRSSSDSSLLRSYGQENIESVDSSSSDDPSNDTSSDNETGDSEERIITRQIIPLTKSLILENNEDTRRVLGRAHNKYIKNSDKSLSLTKPMHGIQKEKDPDIKNRTIRAYEPRLARDKPTNRQGTFPETAIDLRRSLINVDSSRLVYTPRKEKLYSLEKQHFGGRLAMKRVHQSMNTDRMCLPPNLIQGTTSRSTIELYKQRKRQPADDTIEVESIDTCQYAQMIEKKKLTSSRVKKEAWDSKWKDACKQPFIVHQLISGVEDRHRPKRSKSRTCLLKRISQSKLPSLKMPMDIHGPSLEQTHRRLEKGHGYTVAERIAATRPLYSRPFSGLFSKRSLDNNPPSKMKEMNRKSERTRVPSCLKTNKKRRKNKKQEHINKTIEYKNARRTQVRKPNSAEQTFSRWQRSREYAKHVFTKCILKNQIKTILKEPSKRRHPEINKSSHEKLAKPTVNVQSNKLIKTSVNSPFTWMLYEAIKDKKVADKSVQQCWSNSYLSFVSVSPKDKVETKQKNDLDPDGSEDSKKGYTAKNQSTSHSFNAPIFSSLSSRNIGKGDMKRSCQCQDVYNQSSLMSLNEEKGNAKKGQTFVQVSYLNASEDQMFKKTEKNMDQRESNDHEFLINCSVQRPGPLYNISNFHVDENNRERNGGIPKQISGLKINEMKYEKLKNQSNYHDKLIAPIATKHSSSEKMMLSTKNSLDLMSSHRDSLKIMESIKREVVGDENPTYTAKHLEGKASSYLIHSWKYTNAMRKRIQTELSDQASQVSKQIKANPAGLKDKRGNCNTIQKGEHRKYDFQEEATISKSRSGDPSYGTRVKKPSYDQTAHIMSVSSDSKTNSKGAHDTIRNASQILRFVSNDNQKLTTKKRREIRKNCFGERKEESQLIFQDYHCVINTNVSKTVTMNKDKDKRAKAFDKEHESSTNRHLSDSHLELNAFLNLKPRQIWKTYTTSSEANTPFVLQHATIKLDMTPKKQEAVLDLASQSCYERFIKDGSHVKPNSLKHRIWSVSDTVCGKGPRFKFEPDLKKLSKCLFSSKYDTGLHNGHLVSKGKKEIQPANSKESIQDTLESSKTELKMLLENVRSVSGDTLDDTVRITHPKPIHVTRTNENARSDSKGKQSCSLLPVKGQELITVDMNHINNSAISGTFSPVIQDGKMLSARQKLLITRPPISFKVPFSKGGRCIIWLSDVRDMLTGTSLRREIGLQQIIDNTKELFTTSCRGDEMYLRICEGKWGYKKVDEKLWNQKAINGEQDISVYKQAPGQALRKNISTLYQTLHVEDSTMKMGKPMNEDLSNIKNIDEHDASKWCCEGNVTENIEAKAESCTGNDKIKSFVTQNSDLKNAVIFGKEEMLNACNHINKLSSKVEQEEIWKTEGKGKTNYSGYEPLTKTQDEIWKTEGIGKTNYRYEPLTKTQDEIWKTEGKGKTNYRYEPLTKTQDEIWKTEGKGKTNYSGYESLTKTQDEESIRCKLISNSSDPNDLSPPCNAKENRNSFILCNIDRNSRGRNSLYQRHNLIKGGYFENKHSSNVAEKQSLGGFEQRRKGGLDRILDDSIQFVFNDCVENIVEMCIENYLEECIENAANHCIQNMVDKCIYKIVNKNIENIVEENIKSNEDECFGDTADRVNETNVEESIENIEDELSINESFQSYQDSHVDKIADDCIQNDVKECIEIKHDGAVCIQGSLDKHIGNTSNKYKENITKEGRNATVGRVNKGHTENARHTYRSRAFGEIQSQFLPAIQSNHVNRRKTSLCTFLLRWLFSFDRASTMVFKTCGDAINNSTVPLDLLTVKVSQNKSIDDSEEISHVTDREAKLNTGRSVRLNEMRYWNEDNTDRGVEAEDTGYSSGNSANRSILFENSGGASLHNPGVVRKDNRNSSEKLNPPHDDLESLLETEIDKRKSQRGRNCSKDLSDLLRNSKDGRKNKHQSKPQRFDRIKWKSNCAANQLKVTREGESVGLNLITEYHRERQKIKECSAVCLQYLAELRGCSDDGVKNLSSNMADTCFDRQCKVHSLHLNGPSLIKEKSPSQRSVRQFNSAKSLCHMPDSFIGHISHSLDGVTVFSKRECEKESPTSRLNPLIDENAKTIPSARKSFDQTTQQHLDENPLHKKISELGAPSLVSKMNPPYIIHSVHCARGSEYAEKAQISKKRPKTPSCNQNGRLRERYPLKDSTSVSKCTFQPDICNTHALLKTKSDFRFKFTYPEYSPQLCNNNFSRKTTDNQVNEITRSDALMELRTFLWSKSNDQRFKAGLPSLTEPTDVDASVDTVSLNSSEFTLSWANSSHLGSSHSDESLAILDTKINNNENNAACNDQSDILSQWQQSANTAVKNVHNDCSMVSSPKTHGLIPSRHTAGFCRSYVADDVYHYFLQEDDDFTK